VNKLSDTQVVIAKVTFTVPNVLINYDNGVSFPTLKLRQGGSMQVDATISTDFYDEPLDERKNVFAFKARNQINFGSYRIDVLNDEIKGDKPIAPSCPTASQYMANVGKTVMISFSCVRSEAHSRGEGKNVYKVARSTITLP